MANTSKGAAVAAIIRSNAKQHNEVIKQGYISPVVDKRLKGATIGILEHAVGGEDARRLILALLFKPGDKLEPISSKTLDESQWAALVNWVEPHKNETTNKWEGGSKFMSEALAVLTDATRIFYTGMSQEDRAAFGEYDAGSVVGAAVSLGGQIVAMDDTGAEHDDITIPPAKVKRPKLMGNYLDRLLFTEEELGGLDDDVNF